MIEFGGFKAEAFGGIRKGKRARKNPMNKLTSLILAALLCAGPAFSADTPLNAPGYHGEPLRVVPVDPLTGDPRSIVYTYTAAIAGLVPAVAATDIFCISGSATKTVRVLRMSIGATATAAAVGDIILVKRSTANTAGTSTAPAVVANDSTNPAGTAVALAYTANPTTGTLVGNVRTRKLAFGTIAGSVIDSVDFTWTVGGEQALVLRGVAQAACLNYNGQTMTGNAVNIGFMWSEE